MREAQPQVQQVSNLNLNLNLVLNLNLTNLICTRPDFSCPWIPLHLPESCQVMDRLHPPVGSSWSWSSLLPPLSPSASSSLTRPCRPPPPSPPICSPTRSVACSPSFPNRLNLVR